jgi:hypothetical protein
MRTESLKFIFLRENLLFKQNIKFLISLSFINQIKIRINFITYRSKNK